MAFSPKQEKVLAFPYSDYDAVICDGAVRSGKSIVILLAFVLWAMNTFNKYNFAIAAKTISSGIRNLIRPLMQIQYLQNEFTISYTASTNLLTVRRGKKVNYFYLFGGSDESSYQIIQGITLAGVILDEVALMPRSFVEQALARCSVEGSKMFFSCNPEGPEHWFFQEWVLMAQQKNALYLHFTMDDNPSLSDKVKERYHRMYVGVFFQRYILGLWVKAEGIIYALFANHPEQFIINEVPKDIFLIRVGVDFGGTKSATSFIATGFTTGYKEVIILENERITEELSPEKLDAKFVEFITMVKMNYGKFFYTRADSAESILIRGLKTAAARAGASTIIRNAKKTSILGRIKLTNRLFGQGRLKIMRHCKSIQTAFRTSVWDAKKVDTRLDDGSIYIDDLDAFEYTIEEDANKLINAVIPVNNLEENKKMDFNKKDFDKTAISMSMGGMKQ